MSTITFAEHKKSGDHVKVLAVPTNRSQETRFNLLDGLIVGFFLVSVGGLLWLLLS